MAGRGRIPLPFNPFIRVQEPHGAGQTCSDNTPSRGCDSPEFAEGGSQVGDQIRVVHQVVGQRDADALLGIGEQLRQRGIAATKPEQGGEFREAARRLGSPCKRYREVDSARHGIVRGAVGWEVFAETAAFSPGWGLLPVARPGLAAARFPVI